MICRARWTAVFSVSGVDRYVLESSSWLSSVFFVPKFVVINALVRDAYIFPRKHWALVHSVRVHFNICTHRTVRNTKEFNAIARFVSHFKILLYGPAFRPLWSIGEKTGPLSKNPGGIRKVPPFRMAGFEPALSQLMPRARSHSGFIL